MIKILQAKTVRDHVVYLVFSDGSTGEYDMAELVARDGEMVRPLRDPDFFNRHFLELGAICWPNGFELSGESIHRKLDLAGVLQPVAAA
jgi:hypothetical protein